MSAAPQIPRSFFWQLPLFLLVWCLIVEVFVRLFLVSPAQSIDDPILGARMPPNSSLLVPDTDAGYRRISTNELGFNDDPISPKNGRKRFIVLGDSYVEAFQVSRISNFMHIVERDVPTVQLLNFGQSGLNPITETVVFDRLDKSMSPDGVIVVVNNGDENDILSSGVMVKHCSSLHLVCDYVLPARSPDEFRQWLSALRGAFALTKMLYNKYNISIDLLQLWSARVPANHGQRPGGWKTLSSPDVEGLLTLLFSRIQRRHPLVVVFVPSLDYTAGRRTQIEGSAEFMVRTKNAAREAGATFLDAHDVLADAYARYGQPPQGFDFRNIHRGHLNELGHVALAKLIERSLLLNQEKFGQ